MRRRRRTIWGIATLLSAIAVIAAVGVHSASTAVKPRKAEAGSAAAAKASALAPADVRVNALPFTRLDLVLLLAGGGMLLVVGSSVRRVRAEGSAR